ncbi:MAG: hypothetical protein K2K02_10780 [Ruminococcus sp.]|nr:hypothetical protein [Ruminococcus sp.]
MLKNFLIGTFAVLMISTATSINSIAGEIDNTTDEVINVTEETLTYDVTVDVTSGNVILISEDAERYGINTVKLNLEVNAEDVYCEFEPENSVKITASRYDNESHMLNIYMSGTDPLFDSDGKLSIGSIKNGSGELVTDIKVKSVDYVFDNDIVSFEVENPELPEETTTKEEITTTTTATKPATTTTTTKTAMTTTTAKPATTTTATKPVTTTSTKKQTTTSATSTTKPATTTTATVKDDLTGVLRIEESGEIILVSNHAEEDGINTLQLSLNIDTGDDAEISFEFNPENKNKISEYRVDGNTLNIYMSGTEHLFDDKNSLNLGVIKVTDKFGHDIVYSISTTEESLKYVYVNNIVNVRLTIEGTHIITAFTTTTTTSATTTSTKTTTATTTSDSTTKEITSTSTTKTTTSKTTTTTVTTEAPHIASDDELCEWSMKNYNDEKGIMPDSAEISETADGKYQITLTDKSDNVLDVYLINPETGIGTDSSGNRVDLPKTGNNSLRNILTSVGALIMTASGFFAVKHSGTGRRKKDEQ